MKSMRIAALSDIGLVRSRNEDAFWYDLDRAIFVLADGLGGHKAGEVAAAAAVRIAADRLSLAVDEGLRDVLLAEAMQEAFSVASEQIYARGKESEAFSGMACSIVAGILQDDNCLIAHAGDTRAYLFFNDSLSQVTVDDTPVGALIKRGYLLPEKARSHSLKNFLIKSIGSHPTVDANISKFPVKAGDRLLFCSDGLWGIVEHEAMSSVLQRILDPNEVCEELVRMARANGGHDNITVIVAQVEERPVAEHLKTAEMMKPNLNP
jgi:serine/threonine protein phosphatase PrpC